MLGIGRYSVGSHRNSQVINFQYIEDDYCSSAELGLAGFAVNELEPCEAQARGFTHGHRKVYGVPEPAGPEVLQQFRAICNDAGAPATSSLIGLLAEIVNTLVQCATTLQYETATLPAKQMQHTVPAEKFTVRQQELSRLDGGLEIDGSYRQKVEPSPEEPLGHIAAEKERASQEHRPLKDTYRELPLTGCHNSLLPVYRQPHLAFQAFPMLDEFGRHERQQRKHDPRPQVKIADRPEERRDPFRRMPAGLDFAPFGYGRGFEGS